MVAQGNQERFWARVDRSGECWLWDRLDGNGYGSFGGRGAHVVAWEGENGPLPPGLHVHHRCGNHACVRPAHLEALTNSAHRRIHMGATRACGLVRVSTDRQGGGHSPQVQRQAILAHARALGYVLEDTDIFEDHESGHALGRTGYQSVLAGVREGRYSAVVVYALDRWGRDSIERQQRGKEFDRLGVALISATEGKDEQGLVRVIRAELAEEESRRNGRRVQPTREAAARAGLHVGQTPYGFSRRYPEHSAGERQPAGQLVPAEPAASVVRELFSRYSAGLWSLKDLALDLNSRGVPAPDPARRGTETAPVPWTSGTISRLLRNPTYAGLIRYNRKPQGRFARAKEGTEFTVPGKHEPLVTQDVFDLVQRRLADGCTYTRVRGGRIETVVARMRADRPLLAGLLRCHACGGPMDTLSSREGRLGEARCHARASGQGCTAQSYRLEPATEALLREVGRLKGAPWTVEQEMLLAGEQGQAAAALDQELAQARARLDRATQRFMVEIEEPTAEERASFERVRAALGARIRELEQQQAQLAHDAQALPRLRALHAKLRSTELGPLCGRLLEQGNTVAVRDLIRELVASAVLVERWPEHRSTWVRLAVTWTPDVQVLLDAGLLVLAPQIPGPPQENC